jgi:hypothetical protein
MRAWSRVVAALYTSAPGSLSAASMYRPTPLDGVLVAFLRRNHLSIASPTGSRSRQALRSIGHITFEVKCAGARSAGNPHATCDVAVAGNQVTVRLVRHSQRKRGAMDRPNLRTTAPVLDPTGSEILRDANLQTGTWTTLQTTDQNAEIERKAPRYKILAAELGLHGSFAQSRILSGGAIYL